MKLRKFRNLAQSAMLRLEKVPSYDERAVPRWAVWTLSQEVTCSNPGQYLFQMIIFKSPIFGPNSLDSTSILGQFLRTRKNYPKNRGTVKRIWPKNRALRNYVQISTFSQKSGHLYINFEGTIFGPNPLKSTSIFGHFCGNAKITLKSRYY